jgi:hypothetical protein
MAHIEPDKALDTRSSPPDGLPFDLLVPVALGLLTSEDGLGSIKRALRGAVAKDPMDALITTVVGGGIAFWMAEREHNPACRSPWDGILYVATCLSVGYDNLFPSTATGHAIASAVQTFGPALAGKAFDAPAAETAAIEATDVNHQILSRLDDIVRLLEAQAGESK